MDVEAIDRNIEDFRIGDRAKITWNVTKQDIASFANLSGDFNPLHTDIEYAISEGYRDCVAHGLLLSSKLSSLIGMKLPGRRCLLIDQTLAYPNPAYAGDRLNLSATITNLHLELRIVELKVSITKIEANAKTGNTVARGKMTCKILSS